MADNDADLFKEPEVAKEKLQSLLFKEPEVAKEKLQSLGTVTNNAGDNPTPPTDATDAATKPEVAPASTNAEAQQITTGQLPLGNEPQLERPRVADEPKTWKSLDDYRKLDWTKTNKDLANETGVSRERIRQVRHQLKNLSDKPADFSDVTGQATLSTEPTPEKIVNYEAMAEAVFDMSTGTLAIVFGEEWKPRNTDERQVVCVSLATYFKSKEMQDLPPGVMLTVVLLAYSAPRLRAPNTANKLKMVWQWCKVKVGGLFKRKGNYERIEKL